jgi:hypothetical protein
MVLVGQQHHHDIGILDRLANFLDLETGLFRLVPRSTALAQANRYLDPGILEVLGMGMALRAIADDGHFLALDEGEVGILVVINFHSFSLVSEFRL